MSVLLYRFDDQEQLFLTSCQVALLALLASVGCSCRYSVVDIQFSSTLREEDFLARLTDQIFLRALPTYNYSLWVTSIHSFFQAVHGFSYPSILGTSVLLFWPAFIFASQT